MFERYTEKACRVIFFGRYEASRYGSSFIETEHLLLGLLRENPEITQLFSSGSEESILKQIDANTGSRTFRLQWTCCSATNASGTCPTVPRRRKACCWGCCANKVV